MSTNDWIECIMAGLIIFVALHFAMRPIYNKQHEKDIKKMMDIINRNKH